VTKVTHITARHSMTRNIASCGLSATAELLVSFAGKQALDGHNSYFNAAVISLSGAQIVTTMACHQSLFTAGHNT